MRRLIERRKEKRYPLELDVTIEIKPNDITEQIAEIDEIEEN